jgi:thiamine biosynthesis lipoprotein ApbE
MLAEIATMGTVFTLTVDEDSQLVAVWNDLVNEVTHELERIDDTFSTYRVNSEVSRFRRGEGVVHSEDFDEVKMVLNIKNKK